MEENLLDNDHHKPQVLEEAGKGIRLATYIIDLIVVYAIIFAITVMILVGTNNYNPDDTSPILDRLLGIAVIVVYYFIMESIAGKTLGKLLLKTRVVNMKGEKPTSKQILGRSFARVVPFEAFSFLGSSDRGWHDKWSNTMVVKEK